jgi:hypothetical protein
VNVRPVPFSRGIERIGVTADPLVLSRHLQRGLSNSTSTPLALTVKWAT